MHEINLNYETFKLNTGIFDVFWAISNERFLL